MFHITKIQALDFNQKLHLNSNNSPEQTTASVGIIN
jgi:hypothetical protein